MTNTGGKIDLRRILQLARRRRLFLIIPPIVALIGAYYRISTMEPVYRSTTSILIDQGYDMLKDMSNLLPNADERRAPRMRDMAEDIQKELLSGKILGEVIVRIQLPPSQSMREQVALARQENPEADEAVLLRNMQVDWLAARLAPNILFPKRGNYVEISFDHKDPELAYNIVKTLADVFIEHALQSESLGLESTRKFSEEKEETYRRELETAEASLEALKVQMARESSRSLMVNATNQAAVNARINALTVDINRQQQRLQEITAQAGGLGDRLSVSEYGTGAALQRQMHDKARRVAALTVQFNWNDAEVIKVNQDLAVLRDQYRNEAAKAAAAGSSSEAERELAIQRQMAQLDLELLVEQKRTLEGYDAEYRNSNARRPSWEQELQERERKVSELRAIVQTFEGQARGITLKDELRRTDVETRYRIINPANRPVTPLTAAQDKILIVALLGGLGFGVGVVYLLEFFDHSFKSVEEVETFLGLVVLGTIPRMQAAEGPRARNPLALSILAISIVAALVVAFVLMRQSL